jgi:AcrR family transcriptional regulator
MKRTSAPEPPDASGTRKQRALATRRRVLVAAYDLICETGYAATTMTAIARRARVAEQTLYFTFRNKPAIVNEVLHATVVGFDRWSPTLDLEVRQDHQATAREKFPWFEPFESERDPRRALEVYVDGTVEILARVGPLLAAVSGLGLPELQPTLDASEALRYEASEMIVQALKVKGRGLRQGLSSRRAADVFHVLTSPELHHQLTAGRGWSATQVGSWLVDLLAQQLLAGR